LPYFDVPPKFGRRRWIILAVIFLIALAFDRMISTAVLGSGLQIWLKASYLPHHFPSGTILRTSGQGILIAITYFAMAIAALVILWQNQPSAKNRAMTWFISAQFVLCSGLVSLSNALFKWIVGRERPIHGIEPFSLHFFRGGLPGLLREDNLSFPSGDAAWAFAMAVSLSVVLPRWRTLWWFLAVVTAVERVLESAHYPSDVTAGAALGIFSALLVWQVFFDVGRRQKPRDVPGTLDSETGEPRGVLPEPNADTAGPV
jgi:membrane-associated phospholipid phosphatase